MRNLRGTSLWQQRTEKQPAGTGENHRSVAGWCRFFFPEAALVDSRNILLSRRNG
jgi:hypothetical protein